MRTARSRYFATMTKPAANAGISGRETVTDKSLGLSRHILAALAATPAAAQNAGPRWTPQQTKDALKDAKGTKLVLLGTAAGPVPGRSAGR